MATRHLVPTTLALIATLLLCSPPGEAANVRAGKPVLPLKTTLVSPPIFANTFECAVTGVTSQNFSFKVEIITIAPGGGTLATADCASAAGCWSTAAGNGYPGYCRITVGGTNTPEAVRGALKGLEYELNSDGYFTYFGTTSVEAH